MVFSSIPIYLDPPNWPHPQQSNRQQVDVTMSSQLPLPPRPPSIGGGGTGSIRPRSMTDRAKLAKIPQLPDQGALIKCPRCESTNTKFCYFNNYSLTQPRHFCKTCRRYWTKGGNLRNVPVGGGCRRSNKRSKSSSSNRSKSPNSQNHHQQTLSITSTPTPLLSSNTCNNNNNYNDHFAPPSLLPSLHPLHHATGYDPFDSPLSFDTIQPTFAGVSAGNVGVDVEFRNGINSRGSGGSSGSEQWQYPNFLGNLGTSNGLMYTFEGDQLGSGVKMEENNHHHHHHQGMNLSRNFLGVQGRGDQLWGGVGNAVWTDLSSAFTSSTRQFQ